jgi:hypothetical protein
MRVGEASPYDPDRHRPCPPQARSGAGQGRPRRIAVPTKGRRHDGQPYTVGALSVIPTHRRYKRGAAHDDL